MNKIIFICNTPFQCIISIILKIRLFNSCEASIVISNQIVNSIKLYENFKNIDIFKTVLFAENSKCFTKNKNFKYNLKRAKCEYFGCSIINKMFTNEIYNTIFLYNPSCFSEAMLSRLRKSNPYINVNLFDEGYSTYTNLYKNSLYKYTKLEKISRLISKIFLNKKYIIDIAKTLYLMEPDLMCWKAPFEIRKIPNVDLINDKYLMNILNKIFGYTNEAEEYENKYVFFEESFFWDSGKTFDEKIIEKISKIIDKNKFIIKLHPRNKNNRFLNTDLKTSVHNGIPWEIVIMNMKKNSQITFFTITSGSVLSYKMLLNNSFKTYLLYKCIPYEEFVIDETFNKWLKIYLKKYGKNIHIIDNINEINKIM